MIRGDPFQVHPVPGGDPVYTNRQHHIDGNQVQTDTQMGIPSFAFYKTEKQTFQQRWQAELAALENQAGQLGYQAALHNFDPQFRAAYLHMRGLEELVLREAAHRMVVGEPFSDPELEAVMQNLVNSRLEESFLVQERMHESTGYRDFASLLTRLDVPELKYGDTRYDRARPPLQLNRFFEQLPGWAMSFVTGNRQQRAREFPVVADALDRVPGYIKRWFRKTAISGGVGSAMSLGMITMAGPVGWAGAANMFWSWLTSSAASFGLEFTRQKESRNMAEEVASSFLGFGDQNKYLYEQVRGATTAPERAARLETARNYLRDHMNTSVSMPGRRTPTPIGIAERQKNKSDTGWEFYDGVLRTVTAGATGMVANWFGDHATLASQYMADHAARGFDIQIAPGVEQHVRWTGEQWVNQLGQEMSGQDIQHLLIQQYQQVTAKAAGESWWMAGLASVGNAVANYFQGIHHRGQELGRRQGRAEATAPLAEQARIVTGRWYSPDEEQMFRYIPARAAVPARQAGGGQPAAPAQPAQPANLEIHAPGRPDIGPRWEQLRNTPRAVVDFSANPETQQWLTQHWPRVLAARLTSPYNKLQVVDFDLMRNTITLQPYHGPGVAHAPVQTRQREVMSLTNFLWCLHSVEPPLEWSEDLFRRRATELGQPYPEPQTQRWQIRPGIVLNLVGVPTLVEVVAVDPDHDSIAVYPTPVTPLAVPQHPDIHTPGVQHISLWSFLNHYASI